MSHIVPKALCNRDPYDVELLITPVRTFCRMFFGLGSSGNTRRCRLRNPSSRSACSDLVSLEALRKTCGTGCTGPSPALQNYACASLPCRSPRTSKMALRAWRLPPGTTKAPAGGLGLPTSRDQREASCGHLCASVRLCMGWRGVWLGPGSRGSHSGGLACLLLPSSPERGAGSDIAGAVGESVDLASPVVVVEV